MNTARLVKLIGARLVRANAADFADRPHPPEEDSGLTPRDLIALEDALAEVLSTDRRARESARAAAIKVVEDAMRALHDARDVLRGDVYRRPPVKPSSDE